MTDLIMLDYQGHAIAYQGDGWFNATQAAAKFGKIPYEWQRLPDTAAYVSTLERKYGKIPYSKSKRGANGGTWLHPKLAIRFAQWLDMDFAVWCDDQIDVMLRGREDHRRLRHEAASSGKVLNEILKLTRQDCGKQTENYHYANEAKLVNWALSGEFKGLHRDSLSDADLRLLAFLEERNAILIGRGLTYEQRKPMVKQYAMDWQLGGLAIGGRTAA